MLSDSLFRNGSHGKSFPHATWNCVATSRRPAGSSFLIEFRFWEDTIRERTADLSYWLANGRLKTLVVQFAREEDP